MRAGLLREAFAVAIVLAIASCRARASETPPKPSPPDNFVAGSGLVRIGMTEEEVIRVLGAKPERRKETERQVEAVYRLGGAVPGFAVATFLGGPLVSIEFSVARTDDPPLPRVDRKAAESLSSGALALKQIRTGLEMSEILAATGGPGRIGRWRLYRKFDGAKPRDAAITTWFWEVEPGGKALIVVVTDGRIGSPLIRDIPRP